jgi:hypothetical protein
MYLQLLMENKYLRIGVVVIIVLLLVSLCDPFMVLMPPPVAMTALLLSSVLVCLFGAFVLNERAGDERETLHRLEAGRVAYLLGVGVLTLGVLVQGLTEHEVDVWLALSLGVMLVAKLATRLYVERFH